MGFYFRANLLVSLICLCVVAHYSHAGYIDQEPPHEIPDRKPPQEWPIKGSIQFKDVSMSYRPGLPNVLHNLNLEIHAGEKIGIVGRTGMLTGVLGIGAFYSFLSGAGKSSLTLCLLRIVEFSGLIKIDEYVCFACIILAIFTIPPR